MNFNLILYISVSIMLITGSVYLNFSNGKATQAIILGVGFLLLSIIFGLRWFSGVFSGTSTTGPWPPAINMCPDYLTLSTLDGKPVCIDTIGVSQQGMQKWKDSTQTDPQYIFDLALDQISSNRVKTLCNQCKTKKVTWEGVYDGDVCLNVDPPRPT